MEDKGAVNVVAQAEGYPSSSSCSIPAVVKNAANVLAAVLLLLHGMLLSIVGVLRQH